MWACDAGHTQVFQRGKGNGGKVKTIKPGQLPTELAHTWPRFNQNSFKIKLDMCLVRYFGAQLQAQQTWPADKVQQRLYTLSGAFKSLMAVPSARNSGLLRISNWMLLS